ncbi:MAG: orotate phosphoribosyltransferase [Defluviitaleaceae bacterium]|nr:orotate phosphoribosyltransferase [Defluviitaleaceae bacterium]
MNNQAERILTECDAMLHGHFKLTSGRHGDVYMQCAKVQQYPEHMEAIAKIVADGFKDQPVDIVVAPAVGAIVFGYELARQLNAKAIFAERVDGQMTLRRGFEIPKGAKVVAAEDTITTGGSIKEVMDIVRNSGGDLLGVGSIVDRTGGEIDLGARLVSAYSKKIISYLPEECPMCKEGKPIVKPGSRV